MRQANHGIDINNDRSGGEVIVDIMGQDARCHWDTIIGFFINHIVTVHDFT
jgi:hypothetical protein